MQSARPRPVAFEKRDPSRRQKLTVKAKRWSHQDELQAHRGKPITLIHLNAQRANGVLLEADQFTLKVRHDAGNSQSSVTYSKGNIIGYILSEEA